MRTSFWSTVNSYKIQCKGDLSIQLDGVIVTDALYVFYSLTDPSNDLRCQLSCSSK